MAYFAPYIDEAGLHVPSYSDILSYLVGQAQSIFGTDIYLDDDSQDYQYLSSIASSLSDAMGLCQLAVNNQSPQTATGAGLASIVKLNGLQAKAATYSTCPVVLTGAPGTTINSGIVQDVSGYKWDLPASVTIPAEGSITATATCETSGAITAAIGDISRIVNGQYNWYAVINNVAATPGIAAETDQQLRARQFVSVELPSQTPLDGTIAAIAAVDGVTRSKVYENATNSTDTNGIPAYSIAPVVEGGADSDVATSIATHKTIGCGTYGSTQIALPDNYSISGNTSFSRPTYAVIAVAITVVPLAGYTQAVQNQMIANIQNYLNTMQIGTSVQASALYLPALTAMANIGSPSFTISSLSISKNGGSLGSIADIAWNEVSQAGAVTVTGGY